MFCPKCGAQVSDGNNFCQNCGAKLNQLVGNFHSSTEVRNSNEIDREALRIYLGDILALECIKSKLCDRWNEKKNEVTRIKKWNYYKKYNLSIKGMVVHFFYNGKDIYLATDDFEYSFFIKCDPKLIGGEYKWWHIDDTLVGKINDEYPYADAWSYRIPSLGFFERIKVTKEFIGFYKDFKKNGPIGYEKTLVKVANLNKSCDNIAREYYKACELLKKAYSINVIPEMFRDGIYSIYYLYNFISTSKESLTTALLHYDLNEIKTKLDRIIDQQEEIIIQQAVSAAQNEHIIAQNQSQLNRLAEIESNTAMAAQYAEIASNNAEACAWISLAQYVK